MLPPHLKSLKFKRKRTISELLDHAINNLAVPVITSAARHFPNWCDMYKMAKVVH